MGHFGENFGPNFDLGPRKGKLLVKRERTIEKRGTFEFRAKASSGIRLRETLKLCVELFRVFGEKVRI